MNPVAYKARYKNLLVHKKDGAPDQVELVKYLRNANPNSMPAGMAVFLQNFDKVGINTDIYVHDGTKVVTIAAGSNKPAPFRNPPQSTDITKENSLRKERVPDFSIPAASIKWRRLLGLPFVGKGAPEHCQIVLQLARHWNILDGSLQAYADRNMGLDCNGFVGNCIFHGMEGKPWYELGLDAIEGPDTTIDGYFEDKYAKKGFVASWEQMDGGSTYILGRINPKTLRIVKSVDAEGVGHITISEPGTIERCSKGRIRIVESTGSHNPGLTDSYYTLLANDTTNRTFRFERTSMMANKDLYFKIAKVDIPK